MDAELVGMPKREFCDGEKRLISIRLPKKLLKEVTKYAHENGYALTDVVATVLDQFIQREHKARGGK